MPKRVDAALAPLTHDDLVRLCELADEATGLTAGLMAALAHVADHELHRRSGVDFERLMLVQAIDPADLDASLALAAGFADWLDDTTAIRALIAAVVVEITMTQKRH